MLSQESQGHNRLFPRRRGMFVADVRLSEQDRRHWTRGRSHARARVASRSDGATPAVDWPPSVHFVITVSRYSPGTTRPAPPPRFSERRSAMRSASSRDWRSSSRARNAL